MNIRELWRRRSEPLTRREAVVAMLFIVAALAATHFIDPNKRLVEDQKEQLKALEAEVARVNARIKADSAPSTATNAATTAPEQR
jgi:hypothetical protein